MGISLQKFSLPNFNPHLPQADKLVTSSQTGESVKHVSKAILSLNIMLHAGCNDALMSPIKSTSYDGVHEIHEQSGSDASNPAANDDSSKVTEVEGISPPVRITGSYLTCRGDLKPDDATVADINCAVRHADRSVADSTGTWSAELINAKPGEKIRARDTSSGLFTLHIGTSSNMDEAISRVEVRFVGKVDEQLDELLGKVTMQGTTIATLTCPANWVKIAGDRDYGTYDFCVMKYEAKNVGGTANSVAAPLPWTNLSQGDARASCRALGPGFELLDNQQWMTLGSKIAARDINWSGGLVGRGAVYTGHNDNSPPSPCPASSDDSLFYVETDCTPIGTGDSVEQRRILTLASGEVLWDLAGNVDEWIAYVNRDDKPGGTAAWYEYNALAGTTTMPLRSLVPTQAVKAYWVDSWNCNQGMGQFFPGTNGTGGAMSRGGDWDDGVFKAGIFSARLDASTTFVDAKDGFRCVQIGAGAGTGS